MSVRSSRSEVPAWVSDVIVAAVVATVGYVFVYGGSPGGPALLLLWAFGVGVSLFTVYLFYRFVVAVETIAEKY